MTKGMLSPGAAAQDRGCAAAGPTDRLLLARFVKSGDGAAFEALYEVLAPSIFAKRTLSARAT